MASSDFNFACEQCPRTFKLQEFYEKHQRVHELKKQHVCRLCGFVYGAAKGLEGHMETAHGSSLTSTSSSPTAGTVSPAIKPSQAQNLTISAIKAVSNNNNSSNNNNITKVSSKPTVTLLNGANKLQKQQPSLVPTVVTSPHKALLPHQSGHHLPFGLSLHLLQQHHQQPAILTAPFASVTEQARLAQENASLLQKAHKSMLEAQMKNIAVAAMQAGTNNNNAVNAAKTVANGGLGETGSTERRGLYIAANGSPSVAAGTGLTALSLVPISIAASPSPPNTIMSSSGSSIISPSASSTSSNSPTSRSSSCAGDKSKIPSPAGTGNYKIYDEVPEIHDAGDAQQNDSGFFRCTICTREFSGLNSLKKHVPIHTRRVQHKCDTCGYVFGKKEYLLDHMRKHTGEISPVCEVCSQTFNKSLKLKEHQKLHRNLGPDGALVESLPYRCHICKQCFEQPEPLGEHLRSQHSETVYKCDMCDATFGDVRGKNHHMYNEHQLDAFHQKCVWCPVCNQGFTRHYNLKVHMYKSHGKEYLENNFTAEELESLMRPPPGSNTSKPTPSPRKVKDEEIVIAGSPTGILPLSPPHTPKLSPKSSSGSGPTTPKNTSAPSDESSPTLVPHSRVIPTASVLKANMLHQKQMSPTPQICRPGPASLTKPRQYFEQEAQNLAMQCEDCDDKFLRESDLFTHMRNVHNATIIECPLCNNKFTSEQGLRHHLGTTHGKEVSAAAAALTQLQEQKKSVHITNGELVSPRKRRPGPASRTNAPQENRANGAVVASNLPSHLASQYADSPGFPCNVCGKVLMHKQSYVSHMRVIHGDYYGGNKWKGSSVVEMVLGGEEGEDDMGGKTKEASAQLKMESGLINNNNVKSLVCDYCNQQFVGLNELESHFKAQHPYLSNRIEALKAAFGLKDRPAVSLSNDTDNDQLQEPDTKRIKLDNQDRHKKETDALLQSRQLSKDEAVEEEEEEENHHNGHDVADHHEEDDDVPLALVVKSPNSERKDSQAEDNKNELKANPIKEDEVDVCGEDTEVKPNDRQDDIRYEPITEEFLFEGQLIKPCYCILPFVTDDEVEKITERNISEYYGNGAKVDESSSNGDVAVEADEEEDEKEMVIDESPESEPTPSPPASMAGETQPEAARIPFLLNNNEIKISTFGHRFSDAINICQKEEITRVLSNNNNNNTTVRLEAIGAGHPHPALAAAFYPFSELSLPFPLSTLLSSHNKKKQEMASALLVPRMVAAIPTSSVAAVTSNAASVNNNNAALTAISAASLAQQEAAAILQQMSQQHRPPVSMAAAHHQPTIVSIAPPQPQLNRPAHTAKLTLEHLTKAAAALGFKSGVTGTNNKASTGDNNNVAANGHSNSNNSAVSEYEHQIQNDLWPIDCIKCSLVLNNLDNFNLHMNDHWSDDKCCPVCGLLINSKRFNFKQHLKIHTGEKPFVCQVCSRAFRQKAHMVKHVTTHRSEPRNGHDLSFQSGVIVS